MTLTRIAPFRLEDLEQTGSGLNRPECVLATPDGSLYTCDWTLGIARTAPDGSTGPAVETDLVGQGFRPNGLALTVDGQFLFANLGRGGGVWQVGGTGEARPVATELAGGRVPHANFVLLDGARTWITVSSTTRGHEHFTADADSGLLLLLQDGDLTVAADGLNWTNEVRVSADSAHLFVNETFACRTTRYAVAPDGTLSDPVRIAFPEDTYPDGMAFDAEGALWIVCIVSNRLVRLTPDLSWEVLFEDPAPDLAQTAEAYVQGRLTYDHLARSRGARVANLSSIAFGGPDLRTMYLGGLGTQTVHVLRSPVAGQPMEHWQHAG